MVLAGEFDRSVTLACPVLALGNAPTTITTTTTVVLVVLLVLLPRIEGEKRGCIRIRCVQGERKEKRREMYVCMCVRMREREREKSEGGRYTHGLPTRSRVSDLASCVNRCCDLVREPRCARIETSLPFFIPN